MCFLYLKNGLFSLLCNSINNTGALNACAQLVLGHADPTKDMEWVKKHWTEDDNDVIESNAQIYSCLVFFQLSSRVCVSTIEIDFCIWWTTHSCKQKRIQMEREKIRTNVAKNNNNHHHHHRKVTIEYSYSPRQQHFMARLSCFEPRTCLIWDFLRATLATFGTQNDRWKGCIDTFFCSTCWLNANVYGKWISLY